MTSSTSPLRIAVVLGSTRPGRNGAAVAEWVLEKAAGRTGAEYELVDLADHELPFLDEPVPASMQKYTKEHTQAWSGVVGRYDGFVFLTPEYNHAPSAVLKNAIDFLNVEWADKAAGFVSWGSFGGVRAVEQLRLILSELRVAHVRQSVGFLLATDFENYSEFTPGTHHDGEAETLFDQLESWARAMRGVRAQ